MAQMPTGSAYSPQRRTGIVFTGAGVSGAYHAGVMKALRETGIRIDLVAGHGMGAVTALFTAADADARLWDSSGLWLDAARVRSLYGWRGPWRWLVWGLAAAFACLLLPAVLALVSAVVYPVVYLVALVVPGSGGSAAEAYAGWVGRLLSVDVLLTAMPRAATAALIVTALVLVVALGRAGVERRLVARRSGRAWWSVLGAPLDVDHVVRWASRGFWQSLRGAAGPGEPVRRDLAARYAELLAENVGQPGYRDLILVAHDVDARRDLVFAAVAAPNREGFLGGVRPSTLRAPDVVDLIGTGRSHTFDAVAGCLTVAGVAEPATLTFETDAHWRGETHRLVDRPGAVGRLLEEVARAGVTQVIVVSAASPVATPHALGRPRTDPRGRVGEALASAEVAAVRDAVAAHEAHFAAIVEIRPSHQPLLPFDTAGAWDTRSDRLHVVEEVIAMGYEDAYRQFIEPVVGAGGDTMAAAVARHSDDDLRLRG